MAFWQGAGTGINEMSKNTDNETTIRMLQQWLRDERNERLEIDGWGGNQTRQAAGRHLPGFGGTRPAPDPIPRPPATSGLVYLCVGHSRRGDQGAVSVGNVSEWSYNLNVARATEALLAERGIASRVVDIYPADSYGAAMTWLAGEMRRDRPSVALELHFNAGPPSAHGHEHLYHPADPRSMRLARMIADEQQRADIPGDRARQENGILGRSAGSGTGFLRLYGICPCVLPEPFFGSSQQQWGQFGHADGMRRLAGIYDRAVARYLGA
jgi:N-acetylmuramoyl-L-alanine amidase